MVMGRVRSWAVMIEAPQGAWAKRLAHPGGSGVKLSVRLRRERIRSRVAVRKERLDLVDDLRTAFSFEDLPPQCGAARNAVRKPACELLHASNGIALRALVIALQPLR